MKIIAEAKPVVKSVQPPPALRGGSFRGETGSWDPNREVAKNTKIFFVFNPKEPLRPLRLGVSIRNLQIEVSG
jgi:hypothetical protein